MKSPNSSNDSSPLFMMAQLPFNQQDAVDLNLPMTEIMDDMGNLNVSLANLKELGVWDHLLEPETNFLEIGCGRGYLLSHLYQKGQGAYYGIEPIASQYDIAIKNLLEVGQNRIPKSSIRARIKGDALENIKFKPQYFDYIYSYHVFEHLEDPLVMLEYGQKWLKPGGKMIITCPNVEGYFPSRNLPEWRCSISSHRWLPGLSTIRRALKRGGYRIEKHFTYGGYPSTRNWFKSLFNLWIKKIDKGDVMCILSVKS